MRNGTALTIGEVTSQEGVESHGVANIIAAGIVRIVERVRSDGGDVSIRAEGDVIFEAGGSIDGERLTPTVTIVAGTSGPGAVLMHPLSYVRAIGGPIAITANRDIVISELSTTSDVYVTTTNGSITDADNPATEVGGPLYLDITGAAIVLTATTGIGSASNDLEIIDSIRTDATTTNAGGVYLTGIVGDLDVGVITAPGDVRLTTLDTAAAGEDIVLEQTGDKIEAGGDITLLAGDDIYAVGPLRAPGHTITLRADTGGHVDAAGANVHVFDEVIAALIDIETNDNDDTVFYSPTKIVGHTTIRTRAGDDDITLDQLPTIDLEHKFDGPAASPDGIVNGLESTAQPRHGRRRRRRPPGPRPRQAQRRRPPTTSFACDDSGNPANGADVLTIDGTDAATTRS